MSSDFAPVQDALIAKLVLLVRRCIPLQRINEKPPTILLLLRKMYIISPLESVTATLKGNDNSFYNTCQPVLIHLLSDRTGTEGNWIDKRYQWLADLLQAKKMSICYVLRSDRHTLRQSPQFLSMINSNFCLNSINCKKEVGTYFHWMWLYPFIKRYWKKRSSWHVSVETFWGLWLNHLTVKLNSRAATFGKTAHSASDFVRWGWPTF